MTGLAIMAIQGTVCSRIEGEGDPGGSPFFVLPKAKAQM